MRAIESSKESGSSVTYGSTFLSAVPVAVVGTSVGDDDISAALARDLREAALIRCVPRVACVEVAGLAHPRAVGPRLGVPTKAKTSGDRKHVSAKHTPSAAMDRRRGPVMGVGSGAESRWSSIAWRLATTFDDNKGVQPGKEAVVNRTFSQLSVFGFSMLCQFGARKYSIHTKRYFRPGDDTRVVRLREKNVDILGVTGRDTD